MSSYFFLALVVTVMVVGVLAVKLSCKSWRKKTPVCCPGGTTPKHNNTPQHHTTPHHTAPQHSTTQHHSTPHKGRGYSHKRRVEILTAFASAFWFGFGFAFFFGFGFAFNCYRHRPVIDTARGGE